MKNKIFVLMALVVIMLVPTVFGTPSITLNTSLSSNISSTDNPFFFRIDSIGNVTNTTTNSWTVRVFLDDVLNQTIFTSTNLNTTEFTLNLTYGGEQTSKNVNVTVNNSQTSDSFVRINIFLDSVPPLPTIVSSTVAVLVSLFVLVFTALAIIVILALGFTGKIPVLQTIVLSIFVVIGALIINEIVQTVITTT